MFDFLKGGKVNLQVTLDRETAPYFHGDEVHALISLDAPKDLKLKEGRAILLCREEYEYRSVDIVRDSDGSTSTEINAHIMYADHEVDKLVFLNETVLSGGNQTFHFDTRIPVDALPSYVGKLVKVTWLVKVVLERKMAADIHAETGMTVLVSPPSTRTAGKFGQSNEMERAEILFDLPGEDWTAGEVIKGNLVILPRDNFDVTEIRVELVFIEWVSYDQGNKYTDTVKAKVAGKTRLTAGTTLQLPFQVILPAPCSPSGSTENWTVTWQLKGVLARFLQKDTFSETEIKVFTGSRN